MAVLKSYLTTTPIVGVPCSGSIQLQTTECSPTKLNMYSVTSFPGDFAAFN